MPRRLTIILAATLAFTVRSASGHPQESVSRAPVGPGPRSARESPLVNAIRKTEAAVVSLFVIQKNRMVSGSGSVVHPNGLILTNNHVLPEDTGFALIGVQEPDKHAPVRFHVAGRYPERDLAVLRLESGAPYPIVPLGRSHDVMNGESVVVAGNPGGRGLVFTSGIVSGRSVLSGAPNALVMTNYRTDFRPRFIQFDAASNGGNSGGPLINMDGELIGIVSAGIFHEQNIGYAIPADDVHRHMDLILEPELRHSKFTGVRISSQVHPVVVENVATGSPAASAGLRQNDELIELNGMTLKDRSDWFLNLSEVLKHGQPLTIRLRRGTSELEVRLDPVELPAEPAMDKVESQLKPGLAFRLFDGKYSLLPDFGELSPVHSGTAAEISLSALQLRQSEYFAAELTGFLKVPSTGHYRLVLSSDDGSQLWINGRLVINNDGNHPTQGCGKMLRLSKGFHAMRIFYFQGNGDAQLQLLLDEGQSQRPVPSEMLWNDQG